VVNYQIRFSMHSLLFSRMKSNKAELFNTVD